APHGGRPLTADPTAREASVLWPFLFQPGDLPDLPSFPTRRSSDLDRGVPADGVRHHRREPGPRGGERERRRAHVQLTGEDGGVRSEEHTSELQSPYELVCRLLLEKKKPTISRQALAPCHTRSCGTR